MPQIKRPTSTSRIHNPVSTSGIQPFPEKAAPERGNPDLKTPSGFTGLELFSLFTADIITTNRQFIR